MHASSFFRLVTVSIARRQNLTGKAGLKFRVYTNLNLSNSRHCSLVYYRRFLHTSRPLPALPGLAGAILLAFYRPVSKIVAAICGRLLRKWWHTVPFWERMRRTAAWLSRNGVGASVGAGLIAGSWMLFYDTHSEKVPVIGRTRFVPFTPYQYNKISSVGEEMVMTTCKDYMIPYEAAKEAYHVVGTIVERLLDANKHLIPEAEGRTWTIILLKNVEPNAFVLPNGVIFVFGGLLNILSNEHELAFVMAHELSHVILGHSMEKIAHTAALEFFMSVVMASIWCFLPGDGISMVTSWFCNRVASLLFKLPYSRSLEHEADAVGLDMMARACFDPRQGIIFHRKMEVLNEILEDYGKDESKQQSKSTELPFSNEAVHAFMPSASTITGEFAVGNNKVVVAPAMLVKQNLTPSESDGESSRKSTEKLAKIDDFYSTHPSHSDRYEACGGIISSGTLTQAVKDGCCNQPELTKPLPPDYDSTRKLRTELVAAIRRIIEQRNVP